MRQQERAAIFQQRKFGSIDTTLTYYEYYHSQKHLEG